MEYRAAAVIAPNADYRDDASRMLTALSPRARAEDAPIYGLALSELLALTVESPDTMAIDRALLVPALKNIATRLRIDSIRATSEAGSGHPTSCCSAADIMAALFFAEMRFDPNDPHNPDSDRFVLSKGHAAPILYAAWAEAGAFDRSELLKLRRIDSDLEGHPTPRLPFVDVATGSLGQGICAAIGIALNARRIKSDYRTYVLLGDGESAEGSVWEAANVGSVDALDNLCGITDVNGARPEPSDDVAARHGAVRAPLARLRLARHRHRRPRHERDSRRPRARRATPTGRPTMIVARTIKGKGVSFVEGKDGWHGKAFKKGEEMDRAIAELEKQFVPVPESGLPQTSPRRFRSRPPVRSRRRHAEAGRAAGLQARRGGGDARGVRHGARQARREPIRASWRSTPTSRTRRSARSSRRRFPIASTRTSSPSR